MFIKKVAKGVYEVRQHGRDQAFYRGTMTQCVGYMQTHQEGYLWGQNV